MRYYTIDANLLLNSETIKLSYGFGTARVEGVGEIPSDKMNLAGYDSPLAEECPLELFLINVSLVVRRSRRQSAFGRWLVMTMPMGAGYHKTMQSGTLRETTPRSPPFLRLRSGQARRGSPTYSSAKIPAGLLTLRRVSEACPSRRCRLPGG